MNLTTLARVKAYLAGTTGFTGSDAVYQQLIGGASSAAIQFCARNFQRTNFVDLYLNGSGTAKQMLPSNPIISVSALSIDNRVYTQSPDGIATGWQFDQKLIYMMGGQIFRQGIRNVKISYVSGYETSETGFIPATPGPYTYTPTVGSNIGPAGYPAITAGPAMADEGVVDKNGRVFTLVGANPASGQYMFSQGVYTFSAADQGLQVTMTYDYSPADVEQAVIDTIGTWMKQRNNLGVSSVSMANETVSYRDLALSKSAQNLLQPYRWFVLP